MNSRITIGMVVLLSLYAITACGASETAEQGSSATTITVVDPDAAYREALKDADVSMPMYDAAGLAKLGRTSCDVLDRSGSIILLGAYKKTYHNLTAVQREALLDAAISSYCPELAGS